MHQLFHWERKILLVIWRTYNRPCVKIETNELVIIQKVNDALEDLIGEINHSRAVGTWWKMLSEKSWDVTFLDWIFFEFNRRKDTRFRAVFFCKGRVAKEWEGWARKRLVSCTGKGSGDHKRCCLAGDGSKRFASQSID